LDAAQKILSPGFNLSPWISVPLPHDSPINVTFAYSPRQGIPQSTICTPGAASQAINMRAGGADWKVLSKATGWTYYYSSKQPCAKVRCTVHNVTGDHNSTNLQLSGKQAPSDWEDIPGLPANLSLTEGEFLDSYNGTSDAHLIWVPPPETLRSNYSIVAVYAPSRSGVDQTEAWTCGIQAAWLPSHFKVYSDYWGDLSITADVSSELALSEAWSEPTVPISIELANYATSRASEDALSASVVSVQDVFEWLDTLSTDLCSGYSDWDGIAVCVETLMTLVWGAIIATAMSTNNKHSPTKVVAYPSESTGLTKVQLEFFGTGTGYCTNTIPEIFAAFILFLYCAYALSYLIWSIWSGLSSNSWDSVAELVALALNSRMPKQMKYTSAGVETISVFQEPIRILENEEKTLEMVFENEDNRNWTYRRLKRNHKY
jgi:hypothetical protein